MSPDEKTLLAWIVDELERLSVDYWGGDDGPDDKAHAERIRSMRNMLAGLAVVPEKKPYTAPKLEQLDAADVVERLLATLTEDEIRMVLGRVAVRNLASEIRKKAKL